jgi:hypothetical protein
MFRRSEAVIWGGVMAGLETCQSSETPLLAFGEFLGKLRRSGWHPADIRAVEKNTLELLSWNLGDRSSTTAADCLAMG